MKACFKTKVDEVDPNLHVKMGIMVLLSIFNDLHALSWPTGLIDSNVHVKETLDTSGAKRVNFCQQICIDWSQKPCHQSSISPSLQVRFKIIPSTNNFI